MAPSRSRSFRRRSLQCLTPSEGGSVVDDTTPQPGTAKWWLNRLEDELNARLPDMQAYRDLVDDDHPQVDSAETAAKFRRIAGLATTNLTGLAVEATAERISVEGVRVGDEIGRASCRERV